MQSKVKIWEAYCETHMFTGTVESLSIVGSLQSVLLWTDAEEVTSWHNSFCRCPEICNRLKVKIPKSDNGDPHLRHVPGPVTGSLRGQTNRQHWGREEDQRVQHQLQKANIGCLVWICLTNEGVQFSEEFLPCLLPGPAGRLAAGSVRVQAVRLLRLQGVSDRRPLRGGLRLKRHLWDVHRAAGGHLGQEEDGHLLRRHLHLLLPHQALTKFLVAFRRSHFRRCGHVHAVLHLRVLVRVWTLWETRISLRMDWNNIFRHNLLERDNSNNCRQGRKYIKWPI